MAACALAIRRITVKCRNMTIETRYATRYRQVAKRQPRLRVLTLNAAREGGVELHASGW